MPMAFDQPAAGAASPGAGATFEQTYATGETCGLVIENPRGRIRVTGWDRPEVYVRATKLPDSSLARYNATRIEAQQQGNSVYLRTVLDPTGQFSDRGSFQEVAAELVRAVAELMRNQNKPAPVEYEVRVPVQASLSLQSVSGDVVVEEVQGQVRAHTVSGNCAASRAQGDVELRTVSGELDGRDLSGRLDAESVSGDVTIEGQFDAVRAKSVSGSLDLAGPLAPSGSYDFHSVSGNVTLRVPPETGATIDVRGVSADVFSQLPCEVRHQVRRPGHVEWHGCLNGDGATIRYRTVSGHLRLLPLEAAAAATPATVTTAAIADPPAAPANPGEPDPAPVTTADADAEQLGILHALERGEISVEDALRRLEERR
jgi:Putative adhesin